MPRNSRPVCMKLAGGLGNQLFQYSAGVWLSRKLDTGLVIDFSKIGHGGTNHGKSLMEFELPNAVVRDEVVYDKKIWVLIQRIDAKLRRKFSW